ncbi:hypothetical protein Halhy_2274 [Haliscomenobacter hydrossis DSM 1100]|uniref:Uncharacterized protein n=1 Tax=Haliscomenobacter hydrossis (strain ATCC 27775 / DSM 1100 / LMG 10767 / O) TaxID=760192 RepID=F4KU56_HALH1|nr:hypothetical protein Halhy_2274 [Haliscomenobacter hydrossis DSM 1100]
MTTSVASPHRRCPKKLRATPRELRYSAVKKRVMLCITKQRSCAKALNVEPIIPGDYSVFKLFTGFINAAFIA